MTNSRRGGRRRPRCPRPRRACACSCSWISARSRKRSVDSEVRKRRRRRSRTSRSRSPAAADADYVVPALDGSDARDVGGGETGGPVPLLPLAPGRITGLEDQGPARSQRLVHAAQRRRLLPRTREASLGVAVRDVRVSGAAASCGSGSLVAVRGWTSRPRRCRESCGCCAGLLSAARQTRRRCCSLCCS